MGLDLGFLKAGRWTNKWGRQRFGWEKIKSTQKGEKHNVLHKNHLRFLPQKFLVRGTMAATAHSDPELSFQTPESSRQRLGWRHWAETCPEDSGPGAIGNVGLGGHHGAEMTNTRNKRKIRRQEFGNVFA